MSSSSDERFFGFFQVFVFVLSIYALAALLIDMLVPLPAETSRLIQYFDHLVCAVFFADFVYQLYRAENKRAYLRVGWIDLLASIPTVDLLRWGRLFRIVRILRVLRAIRGTQKLYRLFRQQKTIGGSVGLTAFMLILLSSLLIVTVETAEHSNIKTAGDALWWSLATVTTVGYGDLYPVTSLGRIIAVLLMLGGVGLFGSFTALVASYFTTREAEKTGERESDPLLAELRALRLEVQLLTDRIARGS